MTDALKFANQVIDSCSSTNDLAKQLAEGGYPHASWVSARFQMEGRGRLGRVWQSVEGNLFLSVLARLGPNVLWTWVPLVSAVAIVRILRSFEPTLDVRIKWPNDIWINGKKLGGVLCEAGKFDGLPYLVIGVGLNCRHSPEGLGLQSISLFSVLNPSYADVNFLRPLILSEILRALSELETEGSDRFMTLYEKWAQFSAGSQVQWGSPLRCGMVKGLGPSGELNVTDIVSGECLSLFSEDVYSFIQPGAYESLV